MYHNPIFSKFLCMPTLKVTNVIGNFSLSFLSQKYTATDEHGASVAKEKNTVFKFWGANTTLSFSTVFHPHSVNVREERKLKIKKKQRYFLCREGPKNVLFSHSQASAFITSTFILLYIISDSEFSVFCWYNLEEVTILKVLLQNWVFCLDVCKFYSTYATCTLQIGISVCKNGDYMCTCKFSGLINHECTKNTNALVKFGSK